MTIKPARESLELKPQPAVRDLRFFYPDSGRPLTRRDSRKGLRSPPSGHMTNGRHTGYYFIERLGSCQTEPLYLDFSYHLESLYAQPP